MARWKKADINAFPVMSGSYQNGKGKDYLGPFRSLEEYTPEVSTRASCYYRCGIAGAAMASRDHVYSLSHLLKSGSSRLLIFGSSMFPGVATTEPVSICFSTFWPLRYATIVLTPR